MSAGPRMIDPALETVLVLAHREAVHRRHGHLTLEHLLYAAAHHPVGEEILRACGADLARLRTDLGRHLDEAHERLAQGAEPEPVQTLAFRRALEQTLLHMASAGGGEAGVGDLLAALLSQPKTFAAQALAAQGVTRLDVLNFISHGVAKVPQPRADRPAGEPGGSAPQPAGAPGGAAARRRPARRVHRRPDREGARRGTRPARRAPARDRPRARGPLPPAQEQPGLRRRGGRRQDRARRGARAAARRGRRARGAARRGGLRARRRRAARRHALPRRLRGALQGPPRGAGAAREAHPLRRRAAHARRGRRDQRRHDGPREPPQAGAHAGEGPARRLDDLRGVQADREGPRAAPAPPEDHGRGAVSGGVRADPRGAARRATRSTTA